MGNKYGSNIRTYTARNLVWDVAPATAPVPFNMNAPSDLGVPPTGMLPVFYRAQFPSGIDWNRNSRIAVKRAGIFCNFADGLVQRMDTSRLTLTVYVGLYGQLVPEPATNVVLTRGSNIITGADLGGLYDGAILFDKTYKIPYYVSKLVGNADNEVYLTDYAIADYNEASMEILEGSLLESFNVSNIATLNTLYETEISYPFTPSATDPFQHLFVSCRITIDGDDNPYKFYTKSINPLFNGSPVSFDSVIELEVTPY